MAQLPSLAAVGIGVEDMQRSLAFYTEVLGMTKLQTFSLPHIHEEIVGFPGSVPIALMHFTDGSNPNYKNNPVKIVLNVSDPQAFADRIAASGSEVTLVPTPFPELKLVVCLAKDPDGYVIELLKPME